MTVEPVTLPLLMYPTEEVIEHRIEIRKFVVVARAKTAIAIDHRCRRLRERAERRHDRRRWERRPIAGGRRRGTGASGHPGLGEKVLERRQKVGIVRGAQCASRAERRVDFRQHFVHREKPVQRYVNLVDARRDVGKEPLHQRPPDPRFRVDRAGRDADRIEHIGRRERIVDFADVTLRHQRSEALIERGHVLTRVLVQVRHRVHQRLLFRLIAGFLAYNWARDINNRELERVVSSRKGQAIEAV